MLFLFTVAVGLMGPVVLHFNDWLYGTGNDAVGTVGAIEARLESVTQGKFPHLIGQPFPPPDPGAASLPLWNGVALLFARVLSPIGAANVMVLIGYAATACAVYGLLRWQRLPIAPAILGSLIFGFSPMRVAEAQEHIAYLDEFWFVLECALLLQLRYKTGLRCALALGLCISLTELDNPYLGYFGGVLAATWFIAIGGYETLHRHWFGLRRMVVQAVAALAILLAIILPTQWSLFTAPKHIAPANVGAGSLAHDLGSLSDLSLRWWNFLLPFPEGAVLGSVGRAVFFDHLGGNTESEQSTMIGYTALALAIVGAYLAFQSGKNGGTKFEKERAAPAANSPLTTRLRGYPETVGRMRGLYALAVVCIAAGVLFGLPPQLQLGAFVVSTPPYFVHAVLPEIRTLSRSDLLIQLGFAILAALGATFLLQEVRSFFLRSFLASVLAFLILLEYVNVPPWRYVPLLPAPAIAEWLATITPQNAGIVVQYPIAAAPFVTTDLYALYAFDVHHHPIFNGVAVNTPADALRRNQEDVLNPSVPSAWAALGVRTLTIDSTFYAESFHNVGLMWDGHPGAFDERLPSGLALRHVDPGAKGYTVTASPASVVVGLGDGFGDALLSGDGRQWRWINRVATIWLDNRTANPVQAVLWTRAHNNVSTHMLRWQGYAPIRIIEAKRPAAIPVVVTANPGISSFRLTSMGNSLPLVGGGSANPVSVELRTFEPAPVRPLYAPFVEAGLTRWTLTGYSADACTVQAGSSLDVALLWHVSRATSTEETVFLHLTDSEGRLVAQADGPPDEGHLATSQPSSFNDVSDSHSLLLPDSLAPGTYTMSAGLYDPQTMKRLSLKGGGDTVGLGSVNVVAPSPGPRRVLCSW